MTRHTEPRAYCSSAYVSIRQHTSAYVPLTNQSLMFASEYYCVLCERMPISIFRCGILKCYECIRQTRTHTHSHTHTQCRTPTPAQTQTMLYVRVHVFESVCMRICVCIMYVCGCVCVCVCDGGGNRTGRKSCLDAKQGAGCGSAHELRAVAPATTYSR